MTGMAKEMIVQFLNLMRNEDVCPNPKPLLISMMYGQTLPDFWLAGLLQIILALLSLKYILLDIQCQL
jgi:hypothetical protein